MLAAYFILEYPALVGEKGKDNARDPTDSDGNRAQKRRLAALSGKINLKNGREAVDDAESDAVSDHGRHQTDDDVYDYLAVKL